MTGNRYRPQNATPRTTNAKYRMMVSSTAYPPFFARPENTQLQDWFQPLSKKWIAIACCLKLQHDPRLSPRSEHRRGCQQNYAFLEHFRRWQLIRAHCSTAISRGKSLWHKLVR